MLVRHAEGFKEKVVLAKVSDATIDADVGPGMTIRYTAEITQIDEQALRPRARSRFLTTPTQRLGISPSGPLT